MSKSSTIIAETLLPNPHPGEILLEEFLKPMGLSQNAVARAMHVPPRRINEIVLGKPQRHCRHGFAPGALFRAVGRVLPRLQADFDLLQRRREIAGELGNITPRAA